MDYEKIIWQLIEEELNSRDNNDYKPSADQFQKLVDAYVFFADYAKINGGKVDKVKLVPKKEHCGVTAYFTLFAPFGDDLERFKRVIQDISAISIDSLTDGTVCISINIPNVFIHK